MAEHKWSQDVTEQSDALDLEEVSSPGRIPNGSPDRCCVRRELDPSQGLLALPLCDVDADLLYQSRGIGSERRASRVLGRARTNCAACTRTRSEPLEPFVPAADVAVFTRWVSRQ